MVENVIDTEYEFDERDKFAVTYCCKNSHGDGLDEFNVEVEAEVDGKPMTTLFMGMISPEQLLGLAQAIFAALEERADALTAMAFDAEQRLWELEGEAEELTDEICVKNDGHED